MNKLWYELDYEDEFRDDDETHEINRVLYTSREGLLELANELNKISTKSNGRYKFLIEGYSKEYEPPFDYIELAEMPPDQEEGEEDGMGMFYIIFGSIAAVIILAIIGMISIVKWTFF